jgi:hypothetical protein
MKFISEEAAAPVDGGAATMTVDEALLEKACNVKEKSARDSLSRLTQLASLARLARHSRIAKAAGSAPATSSSTRPFHQWSAPHDLELLTAVHAHGLDEAPAKVLASGTISKLAAAHLAAASSEPPTPTTPEGAPPVDPRAAAEAELKKKLAARALECLKNIPDAHGGGAAGSAGRLGGGVKRLGKPLSAVPKKSHRGGGSGESGGDSDDDFQAKKKKHKKGEAVNGKGGTPASGRSEPTSTGKFRQIKVDETLTLLHPGSHLPKAAAFRPRDGAAPGGADGRVGRLDYPVGYVSVAQWNSKKWRCEIVEAGDRPNFRVTADDGSGRPFKSAISPSDVWRQVERSGSCC